MGRNIFCAPSLSASRDNQSKIGAHDTVISLSDFIIMLSMEFLFHA